VAYFTNVDVVGVLAFWLGFAFGSPSCLGWRRHLDGDSIVSADMGYVCEGQPVGKRVGVEDGGRLGSHRWCYWLFSKRHGCLWPFVEGGANGSWPFVVVGSTHSHSSMVVMGPCCHLSIMVAGGHGRSSILVVGTCRWC